MREQHDIVVVGAGQAGLAMSAVLTERGREHVLLERHQVGGRWRSERWESLRFQFPNWSLELPGYSYSGDDPNGFAHWREILNLIENYAVTMRCPVQEHADVTAVQQDDDGFLVTVAERVLRARKVVVATGPFQRARIPGFASEVAPAVLQTDPTRYGRPQDLPDGAVLVVGSGASGCQIAEELRRGGRRVFLSVSRHRRVPRRFRGRDIYWWLDRMGRFATTIDSLPGREWPPSTVVTGVSGGYDVDVRRMAAEGVRVIGRITGASGCRLTVATNANAILDEADQTFTGFLEAARQFAAAHQVSDLPGETPAQRAAPFGTIDETEALDLRDENITSIVWATGYDYDFHWLRLPVLDERGRPRQHRGLSPVPGLYFLGLHWMHTFKSGLLSGVGDDAEYLAEAIDSRTR